MKRIFDIFFSFLGLLLCIPLFIIIAIFIKLDSKGGVFYKQIRAGKNNIDFKIYKFRTMRIDSDKTGGMITIGKDSRITKVGHYLRKFKFDELPQLINVLLGHMSIVGPRPQVREHVNRYTTEQLLVLSVKPGITDFACIKYRNESEFLGTVSDPEKVYLEIMQDKLKLNLEYIENQSFFLDIKIIFMTFREIIKK